MNEERKLAVLKAGIIPEVAIHELSRWGVSFPTGVKPETSKREVLENIREAIESKELVELRMTDLDARDFYRENEKSGRLYYATAKGTTFLDITFACTPFNHYLIPWDGEDLTQLMLSRGTYLKPRGEERVYFGDVYELYYGEKKVFMVCVPGLPPQSEVS